MSFKIGDKVIWKTGPLDTNEQCLRGVIQHGPFHVREMGLENESWIVQLNPPTDITVYYLTRLLCETVLEKIPEEIWIPCPNVHIRQGGYVWIPCPFSHQEHRQPSPSGWERKAMAAGSWVIGGSSSA